MLSIKDGGVGIDASTQSVGMGVMLHKVECQTAVERYLESGAWAGVDPDQVTRIETHGAFVFLAGDRVCKIKRAVRFPYMDFSTLEKRRQACETEIRVNRRTAPELYLDVVPITRRGEGDLELGGAGETVEWAVLMGRFPQECLLDRLAEAGRLTRETIVALAGTIAEFHLGAERAGPDSPFGGGAAIRGTLESSIRELEESPDWFAPDEIERLRQPLCAALDASSPIFDRRKREGYVRRCHGDLHLGNVCLLDGRPTLFDAIEFNEALSWIDVLHDVAFMLMDLEHRGLRPHANLLLTRYLGETGDLDGLGTLPTLLAERALVRAKVKAAAAEGVEEGSRLEALRQEARAYFAAAAAYLHPVAPRLVVVGGLSGSGKTTLARRVAPYVGASPGAIHLRSDVIRKRLAGVPETERLGPDFYGMDTTRAVYERMMEAAGRILVGGHSVVMDAVFARPEERADAARVAAGLGVSFDGIWLDAPLATLTARVQERSGDASDATAEVVRQQAGYPLGRVGWLRLPAADGPETVEAAAKRALGV